MQLGEQTQSKIIKKLIQQKKYQAINSLYILQLDHDLLTDPDQFSPRKTSIEQVQVREVINRQHKRFLASRKEFSRDRQLDEENNLRYDTMELLHWDQRYQEPHRVLINNFNHRITVKDGDQVKSMWIPGNWIHKEFCYYVEYFCHTFYGHEVKAGVPEFVFMKKNIETQFLKIKEFLSKIEQIESLVIKHLDRCIDNDIQISQEEDEEDKEQQKSEQQEELEEQRSSTQKKVFKKNAEIYSKIKETFIQSYEKFLQCVKQLQNIHKEQRNFNQVQSIMRQYGQISGGELINQLIKGIGKFKEVLEKTINHCTNQIKENKEYYLNCLNGLLRNFKKIFGSYKQTYQKYELIKIKENLDFIRKGKDIHLDCFINSDNLIRKKILSQNYGFQYDQSQLKKKIEQYQNIQSEEYLICHKICRNFNQISNFTMGRMSFIDTNNKLHCFYPEVQNGQKIKISSYKALTKILSFFEEKISMIQKSSEKVAKQFLNARYLIFDIHSRYFVDQSPVINFKKTVKQKLKLDDQQIIIRVSYAIKKKYMKVLEQGTQKRIEIYSLQNKDLSYIKDLFSPFAINISQKLKLFGQTYKNTIRKLQQKHQQEVESSQQSIRQARQAIQRQRYRQRQRQRQIQRQIQRLRSRLIQSLRQIQKTLKQKYGQRSRQKKGRNIVQIQDETIKNVKTNKKPQNDHESEEKVSKKSSKKKKKRLNIQIQGKYVKIRVYENRCTQSQHQSQIQESSQRSMQ